MIYANQRLLVEISLCSVCTVEAFFPMPAAGILLMSNVSRETTTLTSMWLTHCFGQKKTGHNNPFLKKTGY